jgi:hypothetical protein
MTGILNWWDGVELWLTGRGFVLQVIVVMPVVLALAYGTAMVLDGLLGRSITARRLVSRRFGHREENRR